MSANEESDTRTLTARGAATRIRIVTAAADLIYAHGVDRTSLDEVMTKAGVSKSQLYHYFADKDAIVHAVISLQTERILSAQEPHLGALDSLKALRLWRDTLVRLNANARTKGCPLGSLASELANESDLSRKYLSEAFEIWSDRIERGLRKMYERGEFSASANPRELAVALLSAVEGGFLLSKTAQSSRPLEISLDMAIAHVARLMKPTSSRSTRKKHG